MTGNDRERKATVDAIDRCRCPIYRTRTKKRFSVSAFASELHVGDAKCRGPTNLFLDDDGERSGVFFCCRGPEITEPAATTGLLAPFLTDTLARIGLILPNHYT